MRLDGGMTGSMRSRLLAGQAVTILILVLACLSSLAVANTVRTAFSRVVHGDDALIAAVTLQAKLMDDEETGLRGYLLVPQPIYLQPYRVARRDLPSLRARSLRLARQDADSRLLIALSSRGTRWEHWAARALAAPRHGPGFDARMLTGKHLFDAYRATSAAVLRDVGRRRATALQSADAAIGAISVLLGVLFLLAVAGVGVAGFWVLRSLQRPLSRLAWLGERMADGDLGSVVRVEPIRELAALVSAMERMHAALRGQRNLSAMLASSLRPDDVYESVSEALRRHVHADRISVSVVGPGPHEMTTSYSEGDEQVPVGARRPMSASVTSRAYQTGRPVMTGDLAALPPAALFDDEKGALAAGIRSVAIIPLIARGRVVATLNLGDRGPHAYSEQTLAPILTLAPMVASAIVNAQLSESLADAARRLAGERDGEYVRARQDALTGLGNRLRLDEDLAVIHARAQRYDRTYSLVLCDVDHFTAYTDCCGRPAGDKVLAAVAGALAAAVRQGDTVYRYGRAEFLIVLPEQDEDAARMAGERVRAAVEGLGLLHAARSGPPRVTISAGIASYHGGPQTVRDIIEEADAALYRARAAGRNTVEAGRSELRVVGNSDGAVAETA